jgi:hypothetical protein
VFDLILNFCFLFTIYTVTPVPFWMMLLAFFAIQLQGTVFNYYYTILRNNLAGGDTTSRIEENSFPKALHGEDQLMVNVLFIAYTIFYGGFDRIILTLDGAAKEHTHLPNWFMTLVSIYGLGFQLLLMGIFLALGLIHLIIPFFIVYSLFIIIIIGIRKVFLN